MKDFCIVIIMFALIALGVTLDVFKKSERKTFSINNYLKTETSENNVLKKELKDIYSSYARELNSDSVQQYTPTSACEKYNTKETCRIIFKELSND